MKRVVITGMGAVTPYGFGVNTFWNSLLAGKNAIGAIKNLLLYGDIVKIGTCLPNYVEHEFKKEKYPLIPAREDEKCFFQAVTEAVNQAKLYDFFQDGTENIMVSIADRKPSLISYIDKMVPIFLKVQNSKHQENMYFSELVNNFKVHSENDMDSINHYVSRSYAIRGPQLSIATACASGNNAIGESFLKIMNGMTKVAITGGAYSLDLNSMIGFSRLGALTTNTDYDCACRPFDKNRDGFVMGSGCGILVLEELEHAKHRGANILGEICGYATNSDAFRATDSDPLAKGSTRVIEECIKMAEISKDQIGYINAHGTSTKMNDFMETVAVKNVFGERAYQIPISSTKSMIGHSIMAAAALEGIVCIKSIMEEKIHGTRNWKERDDDLDLDYVAERMRQVDINYALSNSFGFGGQNSSIIYKRYE